MKILNKSLSFFFILFTGSCSAESHISENQIDCDKKYKEVKVKIISNQDVGNVVTKLLQSCPEHVGLRLSMAESNITKGNNDSALENVDKALKIEPGNAGGLHLKGVILSLSGKIEPSLKLLNKSLSLEPNNIDYLVNYCSTLEMFGKYNDAIKICTRAIKHKKAPPVVYFIRGRVLEAMGKKKYAKQDYDRAKELGFKQKQEN